MPVDATVVFLDLSRFTRLNDVHGDETAVEVIDRFVACVRAALTDGAELIKSLGDGVLLTAPDARTGVRVAVDIVERFHSQDGMPDVSGGIHHGPVVARDHDVLGRGVNLASRLADAAPASTLYATREVAAAAAAEGLEVEPIGATELRGMVDPVDLFVLRPCPDDGHGHEVDPVCGMRIRPGETTPKVLDGERLRWFCSADCRQRFVDEPHRYRG